MFHRFLPDEDSEVRFAAERMMMERLGASAQEVEALCDRMERVGLYT